MLFMITANRSHFGVDGASLKLFTPCHHSRFSEESWDVSYAGSLKQQTPSGDCGLNERFAWCCAQQHEGWKPHVPPLGTGKRILVSLKAKEASPPPSSYWVLIARLSNFGNNSPMLKWRPEPGFVAPTPLLHVLQPVKQWLWFPLANHT